MALVELPVLFRRGSVRRPGIAEPLGSAKRKLPTHIMRPPDHVAKHGQQAAQWHPNRAGQTGQQELEARLRHARCVVRIFMVRDLNE